MKYAICNNIVLLKPGRKKAEAENKIQVLLPPKRGKTRSGRIYSCIRIIFHVILLSSYLLPTYSYYDNNPWRFFAPGVGSDRRVMIIMWLNTTFYFDL